VNWVIVITIAFELSSNSFYFIVMDTTSICVDDVVKKMRAINELRKFLRQMNGIANVTWYRRIGDFPEGRKADFFTQHIRREGIASRWTIKEMIVKILCLFFGKFNRLM